MVAPITAEIEVGSSVPTAVYRLFASDGSLLYVGITDSPGSRFSHHAATQAWWPKVARKTITWYASRDDALWAELLAIKNDGPRHNKLGKLLATSRPPLALAPEAPSAQAPEKPDQLTVDSITSTDVVTIVAVFLSATQSDVVQWLQQMITTDAPLLGDIFGRWDWWQVSEEVAAVIKEVRSRAAA